MISVKDTTIGNFPAQEKMVKGIVDNSAFPEINVEIELLVVSPSAKEGKTPLVIQLGFIRSPFSLPQEPAIGLGSPHEPNWKEQLLAKGWGFAILVPDSIQADHGAGLRSGIIGLANRGQHRKPMHINF
ncbi:hypothetical protein [Cecembia calidifontis]|uniref:hypothetical protein n=1 Tax=Cecembia calidifontis TaxID=1187080 RepID=UPI001F5EAA15|nr:hypothetical protein [Cecembia calidifontis]